MSEDLFATVHFIKPSGEKVTVRAQYGLSLLEIAHANDFEEFLEGACGGALACATCHVVLDREWYKKLGEPSDRENDMLDLAFGLTDTSRLGCQVIVGPETDGLVVYFCKSNRGV